MPFCFNPVLCEHLAYDQSRAPGTFCGIADSPTASHQRRRVHRITITVEPFAARQKHLMLPDLAQTTFARVAQAAAYALPNRVIIDKRFRLLLLCHIHLYFSPRTALFTCAGQVCHNCDKEVFCRTCPAIKKRRRSLSVV